MDGNLVHPIAIKPSRTRYGGRKLSIRLYRWQNIVTWGSPTWAEHIPNRWNLSRIWHGIKWRFTMNGFQVEGMHQWVGRGRSPGGERAVWRCPSCGHQEGRKAFRVRN